MNVPSRRWQPRRGGMLSLHFGDLEGARGPVGASGDSRPGTGTPPGILTRVYPGRPEQVRRARAFLRGILDGCPAADDAIACLGEIAANAVQHSASGLPGGQFAVRVMTGAGYVHVAVADAGGPWKEFGSDEYRPGLREEPPGGLRREPPPGVEHGRGLAIVQALASSAEISGGESGRVVSFRCEWG